MKIAELLDKMGPRERDLYDKLTPTEQANLDKKLAQMDDLAANGHGGRLLFSAGAAAIGLAINPTSALYTDIATQATRLVVTGVTNDVMDALLGPTNEALRRFHETNPNPTDAEKDHFLATLFSILTSKMVNFYEETTIEGRKTASLLNNLTEALTPAQIEENMNLRRMWQTKGNS